ncbi:MAG: hypothetical protein HOI95_08060 [Chromatiales bacterium]|jgi:uncharacterized protein|nr:hypothetical protein [Chromatiales bacterium]
MEFEQTFDIAMRREALWDILMDVHRVTQCIDGVQELVVMDSDNFEGVMAVKMGPMRLAFAGTVSVTARDRDNWRAALLMVAKDRKAGGGFNAELSMLLHSQGAQTTGLELRLATSLTGRIGQMGRPLIKKRVETLLADFAAALIAQEINGEAAR